jgi:hypothetical protein
LLLSSTRAGPLSISEQGGPGRARARVRYLFDSAREVSSRRRETAREWAGHCGHLGPVAMGPFLFIQFLFSISSLHSLLFLFHITFVKYEIYPNITRAILGSDINWF